MKQYVVKIRTTGTNTETVNITLPHGYIGRVAVYASVDFDEAETELGLYDDSNVEVLPSAPLGNWKQRNGGDYLNSMKPLGLETLGRNYRLILTKDAGVFPADKTVKVIFIYT